MKAEVCHTSAKVGIGGSGLSSKLLLGDDGELIGQCRTVGHWGPTLVGMFGKIEHSGGGLRRGGCLQCRRKGHSQLGVWFPRRDEVWMRGCGLSAGRNASDQV